MKGDLKEVMKKVSTPFIKKLKRKTSRGANVVLTFLLQNPLFD